MGQLTNQFVSQSYQGLLNLANANTGFTANLQTITDGLGGSSPLQMSQTQVNISGTFTVNGAPVSVDTGSLVTTSSFNAYTSSVNIKLAGLDVETGSLQNQINGLATTGSLTSLSSSIAVTDLAQNNRLNSIESITGSLATTSSVNALTASINSLNAATSSYVTETESGSFVTNVAGGPISFENTVVVTKGNGSTSTITINNVNNAVSSSFATNALSASYAPDNSNRNGLINTGSLGGSQSITGSLNVQGTLTATSASITYLETVYETASIIYSSGSNQLGDAADDTQTLWGAVKLPSGSLSITGSLRSTGEIRTDGGVVVGTTLLVNNIENPAGSGDITINPSAFFKVAIDGDTEVTGTLKVTGGITGSLQGTASYATNALSSSHAINADTASYVLNAVSSSFSNFAVSSSQAQNAVSASQAQNAVSASWAPDNSNRNGLITTGSAGSTQSITGSLILSGSGNPSNGTLSVGNDGGIILRTSGNQTSLIYYSGSNSAARRLVLDGSETDTAQVVIIGGSSSTGGINIGGGAAAPTPHGLNTPIRMTGSLRVIGNSHIVTGSLDVRSGSLDLFSDGTTVNTDLYLTNSLGGQSNIIKGWSDNPAGGGAGAVQANYTGSLRITGSNNTVSLPQIRATSVGGGADQQGYISGSDNTIATNAGGIYLNTGSLLFPKTTNNYVGANSAILMNFTTSSLAGGHPTIANNTLYAGTLTINSNSGSISAAAGNLLNGGNVNSTQNFVTNNRPSISTNFIGSQTILNHISSSINYTTNLSNSPVTVNNHLSSSALVAGNTVTVTNNTFLGGGGAQGHSIYVSGSQSSNATRNISSNLIGGFSNVVSSSFVSSSNSNLNASIIYGSNLAVSASHVSLGGSAFFGRFNMTGSNLDDTQQVVFAVGTGTGAGSRRTGFLIDSGSNVRVSGSLIVNNTSNSLIVTGSSNITHTIAGQPSLTIVNSAGTGQPALTITGSINQSNTGDNYIAGNSTNIQGLTNINGNTTITGSLEIASGSGTNHLFMYGHKMFNAGEFWSTQTQSGSAGVSGSITFNNSGSVAGTSLVSNSRLTVANAGTYNIQFSAQIETSAGADTAYVWFKKNGTNIADSATKVVLANNTAQVMTVNILDQAAANDYYELAYQTLNGHATILAETASGNIPAIPSVIATITQAR